MSEVSKNDLKKVPTCPTVGTYFYKQPNFILNVFRDFNVKLTDVKKENMLYFGKNLFCY